MNDQHRIVPDAIAPTCPMPCGRVRGEGAVTTAGAGSVVVAGVVDAAWQTAAIRARSGLTLSQRLTPIDRCQRHAAEVAAPDREVGGPAHRQRSDGRSCKIQRAIAGHPVVTGGHGRAVGTASTVNR